MHSTYSHGRNIRIVITKMYAISLSLALALGISTGVLASQANHESEWSNVVSYGETTIAQDSADDFGPWKMMVQPAAGPTGNQSPAVMLMRPLIQTATTAPIPKPLPETTITPPVATAKVTFSGATTTVANAPPPAPPVPPPPPPPSTKLPASIPWVQ